MTPPHPHPPPPEPLFAIKPPVLEQLRLYWKVGGGHRGPKVLFGGGSGGVSAVVELQEEAAPRWIPEVRHKWDAEDL